LGSNSTGVLGDGEKVEGRSDGRRERNGSWRREMRHRRNAEEENEEKITKGKTLLKM
jgi:hypothetical protein